MTRLLAAELQRIFARRLVRLTALLAVLGIALGGTLAFLRTSSLAQPAFEQRERAADLRRRAAQADTEACLRSHGASPPDVPPDVAKVCFPDVPIRATDPRFHRSRLKGVLQGVSGVLAIVGWALGASLVGAEFASRGMTTTLTWETRRGRVFAAKATAVLVAAALLAAVILVLLAVALLPALAAHGAPLRPGDPSVASLAGLVGRGTLLASLAAGMGFAIAAIGRNTAAALGAGFAYVVVLENILGSSVTRWRRWLLLGNVIVFVSGHNGGGDVPGRSVTAAGAFLAAVALTLLVGAGAAFRARDVA